MKVKITFLLLGAFILFSSCQSTTTAEASLSKKGMVKVTILYPNTEGGTFDMNYYATKHMPMVAELLGDALKSLAIDKGISGRTPEDPSPYLAIGYLYFDELSAYQDAFAPHAAQIVNDIPNYTNVQPVIQISEVLK